ncbi:Gfo/Idh/MocA family oxidoreductase [Glycomyces sp. L485]|uniref:Gfo/Idh/MocA family protein n=1 Tax=Glycomyces sp. L485 TaxID=2909235 RepID=UPI001F4AB18F|nr:Gfo/Idh/MocA family oxidoreductase [Glycomyces sp. L485]MCH7232098.1 Gfo/Idh/MocA family oxidoreductase [Glycomyces sp. L485]
MTIRLGILGAGARGADAYGRWVLQRPERARIAAVADPVPHRRERLADAAGVANAHRYPDWRDLVTDADRTGLDALVVSLPDRLHVEAAIAAAEAGIPILLEKPAATTAADLDRLAATAEARGARVWVCHVMRYQPFWQTLKHLVETGTIGGLVTMRIEENIGFWHFAHSYVRGNWRDTATSAPIVLAKTSHDLDAIRWFSGAAPISIASVGSLTYFRPEHAPPGAPEHCLDGCPVAEECPFYAPRYYVDALAHVDGFPVSLLGEDTSAEGRMEALRRGPYGRCVFRSDNDAPDHQQTTMDFADGMTATLSTSAFTGQNTRTVRLTGTRGEIAGNLRTGQVEVDLFSPRASLPESALTRVVGQSTRQPLGHKVFELYSGPVNAVGEPDHRGHSGGDDALMDAFVTSLAGGGEPSTTLKASLDSHRMAFAAERSRLERRTVRLEAA